MISSRIQRLRFYRLPLLLCLVASGLLLARVPLSAYSKGSAKPPGEIAKLPQPPAQAHITAPAISVEPTVEVVPSEEDAPSQPLTGAAGNLPLPMISLDEAQQALRDQAQLAQQLVDALPSAADLIPRVSTPVETEPESPAELPAGERPTRIVLRNPTLSGGTVRFLVGGEAHELQPGEQLELVAETAQRLRFHRGETFGNAERVLSEAGTFEFVPTAEGWVLSPEN